jgi:hypothetical protein
VPGARDIDGCSSRGAEVIDGAPSFRGAGEALERGAAAVEGGIVPSRAERHPGRGSGSAAELEDVIGSALP